ncbi:MAG: preprotein translocase subunit SecG [Pseudomonadales bacterium]
MEQIILAVHVVFALAIIALVLLQHGRGADMGASFGGGSSQTMFGPRGSGNLLTQATTVLAAAFFITSFGLAVMAKDKANTVSAINIPVVVESGAPAAAVESSSAEIPDGDRPVVSESEIPE